MSGFDGQDYNDSEDQSSVEDRGGAGDSESGAEIAICLGPDIGPQSNNDDVVYAQWSHDVATEDVNTFVQENPNDAGLVLQGTHLANEMFGAETVSEAISDNRQESFAIATQLAEFQQASGWTAEQMAEYASTHESWRQDLDRAVGAIHQQEAQAIAVDSGRDAGAVEAAFEHNPETAQEVSDGLNVAIRAVGREAVEQYVRSNSDREVIDVSQDLNEFHERSGWTTDQIGRYIADNPDSWRSDLDHAVQNIHLSDARQSVIHAGFDAQAVDRAIQKDPAAASDIAEGIFVVRDILGPEPVEQALRDNPADAFHLAHELGQFQREHQWSEEQIRDYVGRHPDSWRSDLSAEIQRIQQNARSPQGAPALEPVAQSLTSLADRDSRSNRGRRV